MMVCLIHGFSHLRINKLYYHPQQVNQHAFSYFLSIWCVKYFFNWNSVGQHRSYFPLECFVSDVNFSWRQLPRSQFPGNSLLVHNLLVLLLRI
jgi:hypothetical protein